MKVEGPVFETNLTGPDMVTSRGEGAPWCGSRSLDFRHHIFRRINCPFGYQRTKQFPDTVYVDRDDKKEVRGNTLVILLPSVGRKLQHLKLIFVLIRLRPETRLLFKVYFCPLLACHNSKQS
jgi:hypothetical protein